MDTEKIVALQNSLEDGESRNVWLYGMYIHIVVYILDVEECYSLGGLVLNWDPSSVVEIETESSAAPYFHDS